MLILVERAEEVQSAAGEIRAGGTDLHDRYRLGVSSGPIVDIHKLAGLDSIDQGADGSTVIGALVTVDEVARNAVTADGYAGFAKAADSLATPQIRWAATLGGALLQRSRCWYYRHPNYNCFKKGGNECYARDGQNPNGVVFDAGGCVYPHASTLGMALLAYEAEVEVFGKGRRPMADLYGDGSDPTRDHMLDEGDLLTQIFLPAPVTGEQTAYFRAISRFEAEWPIVECMVRLLVEDGTISMARIGLGGVAAVPMRIENVEAALVGQPATQASLEAAAKVSAEGANPLSQTAHKVDFLIGTVLETLEQALAE